MTTTQQIIAKFTASVDVNKTYTIAELVGLLKNAAKSKNSKREDGEAKVKKPPSAYNLFIKEKMELLKNNGTSPKDRMKEATALWNKHKEEQKETASVISAE